MEAKKITIEMSSEPSKVRGLGDSVEISSEIFVQIVLEIQWIT
jgi:hypothetical protein